MIIVPATSTVALVKFEKAAEVVTTGAKALADVWQFAPSFVDPASVVSARFVAVTEVAPLVESVALISYRA